MCTKKSCSNIHRSRIAGGNSTQSKRWEVVVWHAGCSIILTIYRIRAYSSRALNVEYGANFPQFYIYATHICIRRRGWKQKITARFCDCVWPHEFFWWSNALEHFFLRPHMIVFAREHRSSVESWYGVCGNCGGGKRSCPISSSASWTGARRRSLPRIFQKFKCFHFSFDVAASHVSWARWWNERIFFLAVLLPSKGKLRKQREIAMKMRQKKNNLYSRSSNVDDDDDDA